MGSSSSSTMPRLFVRPKTIGDVLQPLSRVINLGLIFLLAFVLARLIWLASFGINAFDIHYDVSSHRQNTLNARYQANLDILSDSHLFSDPRLPALAEKPGPLVIVQETQLDLSLRGVRRGEEPGSGSAIIQIPDSRQQFFSVGSEIIDGVTLEEVHIDHVIINRNGVPESLFLRDRSQRTELNFQNLPATRSNPNGLG